MKKISLLIISLLVAFAASATIVVDSVTCHVTTASAYDIAVSPNGEHLYVAHNAADYTIQVFDAKTLTPGAKLAAPTTKNTYGGCVAVDGNGAIYGTFVRISKGTQVIYRWTNESASPTAFCQIANVATGSFRTGYGMDVRVDADGNGFLLLPAPTSTSDFSAAGAAVYYVPITNNVAGDPQFVVLSTTNWGVYPKVRIVSDTQFWYDGNAARPQLITIANNAGTITFEKNISFPYKSNPTIYGAALGISDFTFKETRYALLGANNHGTQTDVPKNATALYSIVEGSSAITATFVRQVPIGGLGTATSPTSHQTTAFVGTRDVWMYSSAAGVGNKICAFRMYDDTDVTGVSVTDANVVVGKTTTLTAVIVPSIAANKNVTWTSSNPSIATINATSGIVTGIAAGTTTITVTTVDGGFSASCTVTVIAAATPKAHIYAYDLNRALNGDGLGYTYSFKTNVAATSGRIIFYKDGVEQGSVAISTPIVKGENNVSIAKTAMPQVAGTMTWAIELTGEDNLVFGAVHTNSTVLNRLHAVVDNSPESDYFGRIYMENRVANGEGYAYVLNADYTYYRTKQLFGMSKLQSAGKPSIDEQGYVYWADYGDSHGGVWVMNPTTLTTTSFFQGNQTAEGVWTNTDGVEMGSSAAGCFVYGSGENTKLFMVNEDLGTSLVKNGYLVYNIGQSDGSILRTWNQAPSKKVAISMNSGGNFSIVGTSHGVFLCQNRGLNQNKSGARSLIYYDNDGNCQYASTNETLINGSAGGGMAVSKDETKLLMVNGDGNILEFNIAWTGNVPTLTLTNTYTTGYGAIGTIHYDYAGNLVTTAGTAYGTNMRLVVFSLPTDNNTCVVPAKKALTVEALTHVDVASVTINESAPSIEIGAKTTLTATVLPADASDPTLTWASSNTSVATVSSAGVVTGVSAGTAQITATADGVTSAPLTVTVYKANFDVTWVPNGATTTSTAPADNQALWTAFMSDYNTFYTARGKAARGVQTMENARAFMNNNIIDFMTDSESPWKWLGDYILPIAEASGRTLDSEMKWSFDVMAFFNCKAAVSGDYGYGNYTVAGQPSAWLPSWKAANNYLPATMRAEDTMPTITKADATFQGWYDNAGCTGAPVASVTNDITLYAKWGAVLTLDETLDNTASISAVDGETVDVNLLRSFSADGYWYTLCLPFDMTSAQVTEAFGAGYTLARLTDSYMATEETLHLDFDRVSETEAGVPYLFMPGADAASPITIEGVTINASASTEVNTTKASMTGFYLPTVVASPNLFLGDNNYLLSNDNASATKAFRAYFTLSGVPAGVRAKVVMNGQIATGIETPNASEADVQKIFRNGQIYILKGDKVYTVQGQLVE